MSDTSIKCNHIRQVLASSCNFDTRINELAHISGKVRLTPSRRNKLNLS